MRIQILLVMAAGLLVGGLGVVHTLYALDDLRAARHLAPAALVLRLVGAGGGASVC